MKFKLFLALAVIITACKTQSADEDKTVSIDKEIPFMWENANVYFLLTDRFVNGDTTNDYSYGRKKDGSKYRSYEGGDLRGVIQKIEEGYFNDLGITAIWMTPQVENIHSFVDEGTGKTYAYHGYWPRDWSNIDANLGTMEDYKELVDKAHERGIRILMDVIINHTGPSNAMDTAWPEEWVRQGPNCTYQDFESTVTCTLVSHLADIRTESDEPVELPPFLIEKWKKEGRYDQEMKELDEFFNRTGYPRAPRFYVIKWLTDYVREFGIDGFRVDTAKHVEPSVWTELFKEAALAFEEWKKSNPDSKLDDTPFYTVGEIYNYSIHTGVDFSMSDTTINYFDYGFSALINFSLRSEGVKEYEEIFSSYSKILSEGSLKDFSTINYMDSHDDGSPFDALRKKPFEAGTKLLLTPGVSQIYYGDETARILVEDGTNGDANLRTNMNWEALANNTKQEDYLIGDVHTHYSKLGKFREAHTAVGAGVHKILKESPYTFSRSINKNGIVDQVVVVLDKTTEAIDVSSVFKDGVEVKDYYSGEIATVENGMVNFDTKNEILLIGM
jgi:alpha-amylase